MKKLLPYLSPTMAPQNISKINLLQRGQILLVRLQGIEKGLFQDASEVRTWRHFRGPSSRCRFILIGIIRFGCALAYGRGTNRLWDGSQGGNAWNVGVVAFIVVVQRWHVPITWHHVSRRLVHFFTVLRLDGADWPTGWLIFLAAAAKWVGIRVHPTSRAALFKNCNHITNSRPKSIINNNVKLIIIIWKINETKT